MYKDNMKLLAAVISASMIACSMPLTAAAEETVETVVSDEDGEILTTVVSSSSEETTEETSEETTEETTVESSEETSVETSEETSYEILSNSGSNDIFISESEGARTVKISENGIYSLSGSGSSVSIQVDKNLDVSLEISDLTINNSELPESSFLEVGAGTHLNIILDGDLYVKGGKNAVNTGKNSVLSISGDGTFTSEDALDVAISAKNSEVSISSGTVNIINSSDDGIKAKNGTVKISGGTVSITKCGGDGIQAEDIEISGGVLNIDTWYENAASLYYSGSSYTDGSSTGVNYLWESGDSEKYERVNVDTGSHKGIKAGTKAKTILFADGGGESIVQEASGSLKISGGDITIDTTKTGLKANSLSTSGYTATKSGKYIIGSPDDAISCNDDIEITGGNIEISSSDDGISSMKELEITGDAEITINTSYEGIEAQTVVVGSKDGSDDPVITMASADDGINTSGKTLTYTYDTYAGYDENDEINYVKKSVSSSSGNDMTVNSGSIYISIDSEGTKTASLPEGSLTSLKNVTFRSSGDGIDCNGSLTQNGGGIFVYGQVSGDNSPIDTNTGFTFNSGSKLLGTGVDGMNESKPESGTGSYITYGSGTGGNGNDGGTPPEMPGGNSGSGTGGGTPPEMPGGNGGSGTGGGTPPEMPGGDMPGNGEMAGSGFNAGQYWAVLDSDYKVVDFGELKYSGSFIVYGSDLISGGNYTLTVSDSMPSLGEVMETGSGNEDLLSDLQDKAGVSEDSVEKGIIKGSFNVGDNTYEYRYTGTSSYTGKKQKLSDLTINGMSAGSSLSGNIIFKTVRYRNNKAVGEALAIPVLKAAKGADEATKKAVRAANKQFKSDPLSFSIVACSLNEDGISGKAVYNSKTGKWRFSLRQTNADGTTTKLRYRSNGKGDFTVDTSSLDLTAGKVTITGVNNFTGTATIPVTIK